MIDFLSFAATYALPFLAILTAIVTIHELGHFWAARSFGVVVDRFSIGFGRAIYQRTDKSGVEWRVGWIPLGGYVRFGGDSNDASVPDSDDLEQLKQRIIEVHGPEALHRYYHFKPVWQRAIIAAAGPVANFVLAFLIFCLVLSVTSQKIYRPVVDEVVANTPAAAADIRPGDEIIAANGRALESFDDLRRFVALRAEDTVRFTILRDGDEIEKSIVLRRVRDRDELAEVEVEQGRLGVRPDPDAFVWRRTPPLQIPGEALQMVRSSIEAPLIYIGRILQGKENGNQLSGVIGIANITGKVTNASLGEQPKPIDWANLALNLTLLTASVSIAIGFVNLLPIPVLDGGHLMFYAYEAVAGRPVGAKFQVASYKVGLALVLSLMLFATWNDLQRLQAFRFLGDLFG